MASLIRGWKGSLFIQFRLNGKLYREFVGLQDTRKNRRDLKTFVRDLNAALRKNDFDFVTWFPKSKRVKDFAPKVEQLAIYPYYRCWLNTLEISKATRYDYESLGRTFLERTRLGGLLLGTVNPMDIREVVKAHLGENDEGLRRVTMFLQKLRAMFDEAIEDGLLEQNPARRVKNPKSRVRHDPMEPLSEPEQIALLNAASGQDRNFISLLLGTGVRPGEALALRRKDVDLKQRKLLVGGGLGRHGESIPTKTKSGTRIVDLLDDVTRVSLGLRDQLHAVPGVHGLLFANQSRAFLNLTNWRDRAWKTIVKRAGIPYRSPYVCRHTYAVRMLQAGHDPVYVARQMGHVSTEMVHRHYARWAVGIRASNARYRTGDS